MSLAIEPAAVVASQPVAVSRRLWGEAWRRFRRRKLAMLALAYVCVLSLIAIAAPAIAGTKPIVCYYKGSYYFPCLGYFVRSWENPIFLKDRFRLVYPENLKKKDPESWAVWPLFYQDPYRRVRTNEWPDQPENATGDQGVPNRYNWFGTDQRGVDVLAQMVHGTTIALLVGFVSMGIASAIGISFGAFAGYLGGWADTLFSRIIEVVQCVPTLILILAAMALIDRPTIWHMMIVIGLTGWTSIARLTRGEFIKLKQSDFVTAAEALGAGRLRIMFRHILPNSLAPVLVPVTFGIASAILIETSLSFLGFGQPPPNPSWGAVLDSGRTNREMWWLIVFPGGAIFLAVLAYNLIGEGLQEATDPRLREAGDADRRRRPALTREQIAFDVAMSELDRHLKTRPATLADAEALARIDAESWPAGLATSVEQWHNRLEVFAAGQLLIEYDGVPAVVAAAQRITESFLNAGPITYDHLTDGGTFRSSHDPEGEIYQLVAVGAASIVNGLGLGRKLIDRQIDRARAMTGIRRIIGFTRPARYFRHRELAVDDYVNLRNKTGRRLDPVLEFHLGGGAKLVSTHADFRPSDADALGYGVLIEYPV